MWTSSSTPKGRLPLRDRAWGATASQIHPGFAYPLPHAAMAWRSEEHTSALQSLMRISYTVFCLNKKHRTANTILFNSYTIYHNKLLHINTSIETQKMKN